MTLVFDLGKVLVDFDYAIAARTIAKRTTKCTENIADFFGLIPLLLRYELGQVSTRQFYDAFRIETGYQGDFPEFALSFGDIFTPIPGMIDLHALLRKMGYPTYIFSNTNELAIQHIRRQYPFFKNFDGYVLSYEHGAMKPQPGFYEVLERCCSTRGQQILYIDDRPENIAVGAQRGWKTILHETPETTVAAVDKLGLLHKSPGAQ